MGKLVIGSRGQYWKINAPIYTHSNNLMKINVHQFSDRTVIEGRYFSIFRARYYLTYKLNLVTQIVSQKEFKNIRRGNVSLLTENY